MCKLVASSFIWSFTAASEWVPLGGVPCLFTFDMLTKGVRQLISPQCFSHALTEHRWFSLPECVIIYTNNTAKILKVLKEKCIIIIYKKHA